MRRRKKSVADFVTETLTTKVGKMMDSRRRLLAPFPLEPEKIYRAAWTPEERAALRLISRHKDLFRTGASLLVTLPVYMSERERAAVVTINLPYNLPMANYKLAVPCDNLSFEQVQAIQEWVPRWWELHNQQLALIAKAREAGKLCKTYGQLYRMWPDILSFFNDTGSHAVMNAKVRSPYPEGAMRWRDEHGLAFPDGARLRPEFAPEAFAPFTSMIAECLMLPEHEGKEVATVSMP